MVRGLANKISEIYQVNRFVYFRRSVVWTVNLAVVGKKMPFVCKRRKTAGGQRSEVRGQSLRGQRSEVRSQKSDS